MPQSHKPLFAFGRMRRLRLRKFLYLPLTAFFILLLCFFLYQYSSSAQKGVKKHHLQNQELINVLRRASMPDRTVILTMVDESWATSGSLLDSLLQSFKSGIGTQRLLNHLVIITMDPQAFEYCSSLHPHCIHPSTFPHYFATKRQSIITNPDHNIFAWTRNDVLLEVIRLGYSTIFTDADVLWLRSPLLNFNPHHELTISCGFLRDGQRDYLYDGGIFFLKANAISLEFFKHWKLSKLLYPNFDYEESLCMTLMRQQDIADSYGFRVQFVNTTNFGGFCQLNKDMLGEAFTIHANCCDDFTSKVHDLRIVLDDWIHFRKRESGDNALEKVVLKWPQKCSR